MAYLTAAGLNFGRYAVCPLVIPMVYTYPPKTLFRALQCPVPDMSHPELVGNRIVRFVTKQAPAPQALIFLGGAREGEEGRVLY